ncbi:hypothetical protein [Streptomyces microflavus]|uniref:hypothetical protein n=1 Tax=Streptomyces microflavus TaxID=1919 RepID=UPI00343F72B5
MTHAFYSDAAEKILRTDLSPGEQAAVESARRLIEEDPDSERARGLPDADPRSTSWAIELLPEETGGRGISVITVMPRSAIHRANGRLLCAAAQPSEDAALRGAAGGGGRLLVLLIDTAHPPTMVIVVE